MASCQGCGVVTDSQLCCPKCNELGRTSFFHSQECFRDNWAAHNKLHDVIKKSQMPKIVAPIMMDTQPHDISDSNDSSNGMHVSDAATTTMSVPTSAYAGSLHHATSNSVLHRKPPGALSPGTAESDSNVTAADSTLTGLSSLVTVPSLPSFDPSGGANSSQTSTASQDSLQWWKFAFQRQALKLYRTVNNVSDKTRKSHYRSRATELSSSSLPQSIISLSKKSASGAAGQVIQYNNNCRPWILLLTCFFCILLLYITGRKSRAHSPTGFRRDLEVIPLLKTGAADSAWPQNMYGDKLSVISDGSDGTLTISDLHKLVKAHADEIRSLRAQLTELRAENAPPADKGAIGSPTAPKQHDQMPHLHAADSSGGGDQPSNVDNVGAVKEENVAATPKKSEEKWIPEDAGVVKRDSAGQGRSQLRKARSQQDKAGQLI